MFHRIISLLLSCMVALTASGCSVPIQPGPAEDAINAVEPQLPKRDGSEGAGQGKPLPDKPEETVPASGADSPDAAPEGGESTPPQTTADPETAPGVQQPGPSAESTGRHPAPDPEKPMVALTFDDGPHAVYTDQILDILEENGAVATFFEVGRNLANDPDAVRRAEAMGCEIGSHSYRHANLGKMSAEDIAADLQKADEQFTAVLGRAPNLLRPPYGSLNSAVKYTTGRSVITWSIDTEDWLSRNVDKILATVQNAGDLDGQVILMHSTYDTSVEAAKQLIPWLLDQGYQLVTITELITLHYKDPVVANGTYGYSYFTFGKDVILPPGVELPQLPETPPTAPEGSGEAPAPEDSETAPGDPDGGAPSAGGDAPAGQGKPESPADGKENAHPSVDGSGTAVPPPDAAQI